jgi:heme exporter protein A
MLEAINLGCVRGDRRLFSNLNFAVGPAALIEVRGPNGSGKTSLMRILCGLSAPAEGEVRWKQKSLRSLGEEYSSDIAYVAHQNGVKDELSAIENLRIFSALRGHTLTKPEARAVLEQVGLGNCESLPARVLSAGQRRRLALARLLVSDATVWILDEVLASLDTEAVALARTIISDHINAGGVGVIATHHELDLPVPNSQRIDLRP